MSEVDVVADEDFSVRIAFEAAAHVIAAIQLIEFFRVIVHDDVDGIAGFGVEFDREFLADPNDLCGSFRRRSRSALCGDHRSDSCDQGNKHLIHHAVIVSNLGAPCNRSRVPTRT